MNQNVNINGILNKRACLTSIYLWFQVCITINNIEQVRRSLRQATVDLEMNEQQLSKNVSIAMDSNYTDTSLYMLLKHADESMNEKISFVINRVADNVISYFLYGEQQYLYLD